jgi:hypothetical protein
MDAWNDWELGRAVLAFSALLFAGVWAQLTLFHWGGAFRRWEMVPPVIITPVIILLILLGVAARDGLLGWLALGGLVVGILDGAAGVFLHGKTALSQVSGLSLRNLMAGPPPILPLAYSLAGVLGILGLIWDA